MSTKKTSTNTINYDPTSMSAFTSMQPGVASYINSVLAGANDPSKSNLFQSQYKVLNKQALNLGLRDVQNLMLNGPQFRTSNPSAFGASQLARAGRFTQAMQGNAYLGAMQNFNQQLMNAANLGATYRPLQTGSKTVEQTSGLGSWLPQVAGMGLMAAMPFFAPTGAAAGAAGSVTKLGGAAMTGGAMAGTVGATSNAYINPYMYAAGLNG